MNAERKVIPLFDPTSMQLRRSEENLVELRAIAEETQGWLGAEPEPDRLALMRELYDACGPGDPMRGDAALAEARRLRAAEQPAAIEMPANVVPLFSPARMEAAKFQGTRERLRVAAEEIEAKRANAARKRRNAALASAAPDIAAIRARQEPAQA